MKLRLRLALTTIAVTIPMVAVLVIVDSVARHRAAEDALAGFALMRMQEPGGRDRCEADPARWGGELPPGGHGHHGPRHEPGGPGEAKRAAPPFAGARPPPLPDDGRPRGRPAVLHAYDEQLRSHNPEAPAIAATLADAIAGADVATWPRSWLGAEVEILVRMPWGAGPCAFVLAQGSTVPGWFGAVLPPTRIWVAPLVALFAAVLLAMGPIVGRIRRLTEAVRRSASDSYARVVPIAGSDEVGELARAFDAAGREVRAQLAAKDRREAALREFLANTTHDVMIPLTVLQGHLSELLAGAGPERATLVAAMAEAHYIASIVHNLAVTAKIDADEPPLHREPVALDVLVERVLARHRPIARRLQVELDGGVPEQAVRVDADVTLLEQAVSNVVYNAIRHNRAGGHVAVVLERSAGDRFRLRVVDDGPGVPADQLARLAERGFRSAAARTRAPDGEGLGLHIAARVAALHDIELVFTAPPGGGLQVEFTGACHCAEVAVR